MAEDVKLVDSFLLAIGKTDRGGDVERNVVLDFIRHIRAAQKKEQGESPVNNTQQLKAKIAALEFRLKCVSGSTVEETEMLCSVREEMRQLSAV